MNPGKREDLEAVLVRNTGVQFVATNSKRHTTASKTPSPHDFPTVARNTNIHVAELTEKQPSPKTVAKLHRLRIQSEDLNLPVAAISEVRGHHTEEKAAGEHRRVKQIMAVVKAVLCGGSSVE